MRPTDHRERWSASVAPARRGKLASDSSDSFESEFVCIARPLERIERPDGGPLSYRVLHRAQLWSKGGRPRLDQTVLEGNPEFSL
ncbi:MAG: phosphodiesterase [Gammaproteobacteria bacterium]|nr:phosphodiesterase [Gammaproteobacteria bacterium]